MYQHVAPHLYKPRIRLSSHILDLDSCNTGQDHETTFALLRVCRQIYADARFIPYTANTFKFDKDDALDQFLSGTPRWQSALVQRLSLAPRLYYQGEVEGWRRRSGAAVEVLTGLRELVLDVNLLVSQIDVKKPVPWVWSRAFWEFGRLELERVEVVVSMTNINWDTEENTSSGEDSVDEEGQQEAAPEEEVSSKEASVKEDEDEFDGTDSHISAEEEGSMRQTSDEEVEGSTNEDSTEDTEDEIGKMQKILDQNLRDVAERLRKKILRLD